MNEIDRQFSLRLFGILAFVVPFLILSLASPGVSGLFSSATLSKEQSANIDKDDSTTSQPATAESAYSSALTSEDSGFDREIPGIGAFFSDMLDSLIGLTTSSEKRFQTLADHFPLIFADLYKVFITL